MTKLKKNFNPKKRGVLIVTTVKMEKKKKKNLISLTFKDRRFVGR